MSDPEIPSRANERKAEKRAGRFKICLSSTPSAGSPADNAASSRGGRGRPRLELGNMRPSQGFMSTGLAEEEDGSSMDQILHAGSMFDTTTVARGSGGSHIRTRSSISTFGHDRDDDDVSVVDGDDAFKISRSGTFEYGNIIKIGYDGIRNSSSGLLSSASHQRGHSRTQSGFSPSSPTSASSYTPGYEFSGDNFDPLSASSTNSLELADEGEEGDTISNRGKILFEDLIIKGKLGSGTSANVKKVVHRVTGDDYAMKVIALDTRSEMNPKVILTEYSVIFENDCEHVVDLFESFYRNGNIYMILEYMNCGSLRDIIDTCGTIPEHALSKIAFQILKGLQFVHSKKVIHRDIKPENILANHMGIVKLADFGMAGFRNDSVSFETFQGTYTYMSPERLSTDRHSFSSDIWSVGLTILECAMGCFPLDLADVNFWNMVEVVQNITQRINIPDTLSPEFCKFVLDCLKIEASERPSATELLEYDFIVKHQHTKPSLRRWLNEGFVAKKKRQRQERMRAKLKSGQHQSTSSSEDPATM